MASSTNTSVDSATQEAPDLPAVRRHEDRIVVRPFPKIIVHYPTMIAAVLCAIIMAVAGDKPHVANAAGFFFVAILFLNTIILAFEFPKFTVFLVGFMLSTLVLFILLVNPYLGLMQMFWSAFGWIVQSHANAAFYLVYALIYVVVYVVVWIITRFDYWEITPNEMIHYLGPFGDMERFPAPNLRLDKEIPDIFEFLLLRSGRLVFHPTSERRAIVVETVLSVNHVETQIKHMLGAMEVTIENDEGSAQAPVYPSGKPQT